MERIRVGVIGCGLVTQVIHLPSLYQLADLFEVTALCDVSAQTLDLIGGRWGVSQRFTDERALLERADVDAVLVANPHPFHASTTLAAIAAGKHVLVEKPMCLTLREADAISSAAEGAGLIVQVGYMRRYAPAFTEACALVREMEEVRLATVHDLIGRNALIVDQTARVIRGNDVPPEFLTASSRLQHELVREAIGEATPALERAYMLMLGLSSHDVSAMREMLGMPRRVLYATHRHGGNYLTAAFDYDDFVCQFATGVDDIPRFDASITVYAAERVVQVRYDTPFVRYLPTPLIITESNGSGGVIEREVLPSWDDPFVVEWRAFHQHITERRPPKTTPADFRQDLELFLQIVDLLRA